jgi:hypothetical protein
MPDPELLKKTWAAFRKRNPDWEPTEPEPPGPKPRDVWVSPPLLRALLKAVDSLHWGDEVQERLYRFPEGGGWSLPERIILAECVWSDAPFPEHGGGKGKLQGPRFGYWLSLVDEQFSLYEEGAADRVRALGVISVHVDWDGSFEPYTLRLPDEARLRNPSVRVLGIPTK